MAGKKEKLLAKIAEAFEDVATSVNSPAPRLEVGRFARACRQLSPLIRCLGIAFKLGDIEFSAKVGDLIEAANTIETIEDLVNRDIQQNCAKVSCSNSRNLIRVKHSIDRVRVMFEQIVARRGNSIVVPVTKAYEQVFAPYHGWAIRTAVAAATYALPTKAQLLKKLNEDAKATTIDVPGDVEDLEVKETTQPSKKQQVSMPKTSALPPPKPATSKKSTSRAPRRSLQLQDEEDDDIIPLSSMPSGTGSAATSIGTSMPVAQSTFEQIIDLFQEETTQSSPVVPAPPSTQLVMTPPVQAPFADAQIIRPEAKEEDSEVLVDMFFEELSSELPNFDSPTISASDLSTSAAQPFGPSRQEIKAVLSQVLGYLSSPLDSLTESDPLNAALDMLTSFDETSGITVGQKSVLLDMAFRLKALPSEVTMAIQVKAAYTQYETEMANLSKQLKEDTQAFKTLKAERTNLDSSIVGLEASIVDLEAQLSTLKIKLVKATSAKAQIKDRIDGIFSRATKAKDEKARLGAKTGEMLKVKTEAEEKERSLNMEVQKMEELISKLNDFFV